MQSTLAGLKVVEFASVLAGPAVGMFLAELGAEVLKIENKTTGGDVTRSWKLGSEDPAAPFSAYYSAVNRGKRVVMLDLEDPIDRREALDAVAEADIVLSNFRPGSAKRMGLDPDSLLERFPHLIIGLITGFGGADDRPAFDVVLQAEAGFLYMNGEAEGPPVKMPVALIDLLAAHQLKEGILLALLRRERDGKGGVVEVSLLGAAVASLANQATNWLMGGHIPQRMGTRHPNIAPYGDLFTCADGKQLVVAIGNDRQFAAFCRILGAEELALDARFSSNAARVHHRNALYSALAPLVALHGREQLVRACTQAGAPAGSVRTMQEVFELDLAKEMVVEWRLPDGSPARSVRSIAFEVR